MDRNTFTGLLIIAVILIGFSFYLQPSDQELNQYKNVTDSIAAAKNGVATADSVKTVTDTTQKASVANTVSIDTAGLFGTNKTGTEEFTVIENEKIRAIISNKGGRVYSVELKEYKTWDQKALMLFDGAKNDFNIRFYANGELKNTSELYLQAIGKAFQVQGTDSNEIRFRLAASANQYLDFVYRLKGNSYMLDFNIETHNMENVIAANNSYFDLNWNIVAPKNEKDMKMERNNTTVYYRFTNEDYDYINPAKDVNEKLSSGIKWVSFKQHYFSSVLISKSKFEAGEVETATDLNAAEVKKMKMALTIPYAHKADESYAMQFYFGPNHFTTLETFNIGLEKQINLGWGPLKYINRYAVIPVFNNLQKLNWNFGIIILILTLLLKLVLSPLTYRSYLSTAKMRILKPEMDEIKAKVGDDDQAKLQQEYMKLYKKAGVNPLGGCVPLLLQMPILFAFFFFFPASIELRQQAFLWVSDLSTYDSIWDLGNIPVINYIYGDHVSLMCLLMTVSTLIYTRLNNQISGATGQMKWMGYIMPIIFMGVLNNVASGLNYYYFLANMMTFGQQYAIRLFVDDKKLHKQIQDNKKKPESAKKSKFQQKLEDMQKEREKQVKGKK
ncbi:MAG: membrane protein insertase YidC [Sphingobacteriales bacterium]|nr:membrane protein insertase YidC [Sphingobacteriales bacterium]